MANILVIDDDKDFRNMVKLMLTRLGHSPTLAAHGEDALALAASNTYDIVICDLMMPEIDGYEVTRRLRTSTRTHNLPILFLTARSQPADREGAFEAGADAYITKPFEPRDLANKLSELLNRPRPVVEPQPVAQVAVAAVASATAVIAKPPKLPETAPLPGPHPSGRVVVFLGFRGGVGKTTLAVNFAGALARGGRRVCLVDLSPAGGQVTLHLRLRPKATWLDLPASLNTDVIASAVTKHESGLFVLAAPPKPVRNTLTEMAAQTMITHLRSLFTDVVVDGAPWLDDATCAALGQSRRVLVVLSPDVAAVQTTLAALPVLTQLGIADEQIKVLLNHTAMETIVPQAAVEKALSRSIDAVIPFDKAQAAALAQGLPLVLSQPNSALVSATANLAAKVYVATPA
ncbi:MAG: response regulator [Anaerolineales bacterium]